MPGDARRCLAMPDAAPHLPLPGHGLGHGTAPPLLYSLLQPPRCCSLLPLLCPAVPLLRSAPVDPVILYSSAPSNRSGTGKITRQHKITRTPKPFFFSPFQCASVREKLLIKLQSGTGREEGEKVGPVVHICMQQLVRAPPVRRVLGRGLRHCRAALASLQERRPISRMAAATA